MNEVGEIRVNVEYLATGYIKDKMAFETSLDDDGFFKTGDLGYYNEHLEVYYVDRMKALIK